MADDEYVTLFQSIFGTYSSKHEEDIAGLPAAVKADQALVEALIERMGNSAAVYIGSSSVLHQGSIKKLDTSDYGRTAKLDSGGNVLIPAEFAEEYFGATLTKDENNYINLTSVCSSLPGYDLYYNSITQLAVITPSEVESYEQALLEIGGYTNTEYLERMVEFFNSEEMPEPQNNTEQSRTVVTHVPYPQYVLDWKANTYTTCFSPSITTVEDESGNKVIYVSHELTEVYGPWWREKNTVTVLKKSTDNGLTWEEVGRIEDMRWASLFELNGDIYLLGNSLRRGTVMIGHLMEDGTLEYANLSLSPGMSAPGAVLVANGRVYKAYHQSTISAPINSDLLLASSWTLSAPASDLLTVSWLQEAIGEPVNIEKLSYGEPNLVIGPDGEIYNIMRMDSLGPGYAAILQLSADGTTYSIVEEVDSLLSFPTSLSKFTIRYDAVTDLYITLSSVHTGSTLPQQRTVLGIAVSSDLLNWEIKDYVLVEREMINPECAAYSHAFQYVDFVIDGDDILMIVREAAGYTNFWHDGNYATFYRMSDYKNIILE